VPRIALVAAALVVAVCCAGCNPNGNGRTADGRLKVVAGENFWGDLAQQIGGDHVAVTSLITNPNADPHLFEPSTADGLAISTAAVVIVNGADYDPFVDRLLQATPSPHRKVVRVATVLQATAPDVNPHFWYDASRLPTIVEAIARAMAAADPSYTSTYQAGARHTIGALLPLERAVGALKTAHSGEPVAATERVAGYLLADAGLPVLTPAGFTHSIENGSDPSFSDTGDLRALITGHRVKVLIVNKQAESPITDQLQSLARDNRIPVATVTETEPAGLSFETWQLDQVHALATALDQ
jgi:zinc/manganese transport system substrate-binding protein